MAMFPSLAVSSLPGCQVTGLVTHIEGGEKGGCFWLQREEGVADEISASLTPGRVSECEVGECVVGRWEEGLYRGRVISREGERVLVQFVDYGNVAVLEKGDVRQVKLKDGVTHVQAIKCCIAGFKDMREWENQLVRNNYKVKLVCLAVNEDKVVFVREVEDESLVEGEMIQVMVTHVSQDRVWVTPVTRTVMVSKMMSQLEQMRWELKSFASDVNIGMMAVGIFSEDGELYRCVVDKVMHNEGKVVVRYVDFGNQEELATGDLFELPGDLMKVSPLSVCVKVEGVEKVKLDEMIDHEDITVMIQNGVGAFYLSGNIVNTHPYSLTPTKPVSILPPPLVLPLNCFIEGEVVHISSQGHIWFTPATISPALDKMMDQLAILSPRTVNMVQVDQVFTTRFSLDMELYRVMVKEITGQNVEVFFLDYGNTEVKMKDEILELPECCTDLVPAAILSHPAMLFNKEKRMELEELLCGKKLSVKLCIENEIELARFFIDGLEILFGQDRSRNTIHENLPNISTASSFPVGVRIPASMGHLESLDAVWIIPTKLQDKLDNIMDSLLELQDLDQLEHVQVGDKCVVMFSEDHALYRATVISCLGVEKVVVRFVDFGNCEEKIVTELYKMSPELQYLENCAVCIRPSWNMEDTLLDREMVEVELQKEAFLVELDLHEVAHFYRGDELLFPGSLAVPECSPMLVTLSHVEHVKVVWVTPQALLEKLDVLMDQLAAMVHKLVPATGLIVGSMVVARYTEDNELYRARLLKTDDTQITILFVDFGNQQSCLASSVFHLPPHLSLDIVPVACVRVELPGGEEWQESDENRELVETMLDKENLTLNMSDMVFSVHGENIVFDKYLNIKDDKKKGQSKEILQNNVLFKQILDQEPECLREGGHPTPGHLSDLDQSMTGDKERVADLSVADLSMTGHVLYQEEEVGKFQAKAARSRYSDRWSVGDKVVAFWSVDRRWRAGVIHELYRSEVLVVCTEEPGVRPAMVELSHVKHVGMPLDALNMMETSIGGLEGGRKIEKSQASYGGEKQVNDTAMNNSTMNVMTMTPSLLLLAADEDLCTFARSGAGSRYLQTLVSPDNKKLCEKMVSSILSTNPLRMMTNPMSCFLVQKLIGFLYILPKYQQSALLDPIKINFSRLSLNAYGYHVVQTAITHLGPEQRECFILELENYVVLLSLLKSKYGTFVAQSCLPHLMPRTVTSLVNSLLGHLTELGCNNQASYFVQKFLTQWGHFSTLDLLAEDILHHLRPLVHNPHGTYVVQTLVKCRSDFNTLAMITQWIVMNMQAVYKDYPAVQSVRCVMYLIADKIREGADSQWSNLLDQMVSKMTLTMEQSRPLLIQAACHPQGHFLVGVLSRMVVNLGREARKVMLEMMVTYRAVLVADTYGCIVMRSLQEML